MLKNKKKVIKKEILRLSESTKITDAVQEWELLCYQENKCGRKIKHEYLFVNLITKNTIILGSGCEKIFSNQIKAFEDPILNYFICCICHKVKI